MNKDDREALKRQAEDLQTWSLRADDVLKWHRFTRENGDGHEQAITSRMVDVARAGTDAWQVIPLVADDSEAVRCLIARANLPQITGSDDQLLTFLARGVRQACNDVQPLFGFGRMFMGAAKKTAALAAADFVARQHRSMTLADVPALLERLHSSTGAVEPGDTIARFLDPSLGFVPTRDRPGNAHPAEILAREPFERFARAARVIDRVVAGEASYRSAAKKAAETVRGAETSSVLAEMPVTTLKQATDARIPWTAMEKQGITTIQEVLSEGSRLQARLGIPAPSATRLRGAADSIRRTVHEEMPVRIDIAARRPETGELLARLAEWDVSRQTRGAAEDLKRAEELKPLLNAMTHDVTAFLVLPNRSLTVGDLVDGMTTVERRAQVLRDGGASGTTRTITDPWEDFLSRAADYFVMLNELGYITEDEASALGDLPDEIVAAVNDQPLNGEHLNASLRGYQSFAARFALVQKKVVIGDEMGLGKTLEAIAVLAHLRSRGDTHFVVISPAAVVTNWMREVSSKSRLRAHRVHGPDRSHARRQWRMSGGVAVTTYETLAWWGEELETMPDLACVVVDEAHYIKNPDAKRSLRTGDIVDACERALLLTGTPLENRQDEFRVLVSYVRPDLAEAATSLNPTRFRQQIAPAYLRRNQEQVLSELPGLIKIDEWLPMSAADRSGYESAVMAGNFMGMRQAAMLAGKKSSKLERLVEIVEEAELNQRRVIVFSYFKSVMEEVMKALPGKVFGPLDGSVPPVRRQQMVDDFSAARHGAVLVSQIQAGGIGLNIQAASVVVLCEPQLKPTIEDQAIARAHRMGQVQSVQVHRLLSEEGLDPRLTRILAEKRQIFDDYARVSTMADATPAAVDTTDSELVRRVVAEERERIARRQTAG